MALGATCIPKAVHTRSESRMIESFPTVVVVVRMILAGLDREVVAPSSSSIGEGTPLIPDPPTPAAVDEPTGKTSILRPATPSAHKAANSLKTKASFLRYPIRPNKFATSEVILSRIGSERVAR